MDTKLLTLEGQKKYFKCACNIQLHAYSKKYADKKFEESCENLCSCGFCNNRVCEKCTLARVHEEALEELDDDVKQEQRYQYELFLRHLYRK